ncbi:Protein TRANSPARENT TESTA 9 [Linum perenne]
MWLSLWGSVDRFSLRHFQYLIDELKEITIVDKHNEDLVVDLVQSIVEIVTCSDRQDPQIFECFMEYHVMAEFVRVLRINTVSQIEAPFLRHLSILIQNMDSEHAIYYCFSNDLINNIITHQFNFDSGDLDPYYISFLRAVSSKVNLNILCLLVKVHGDTVVSFPLYSEALKFAQHSETMIQTAVREITLSLYKVSDDMVLQFLSTTPASDYFSSLVHRMKEQCSHLSDLVQAVKESFTDQGRKELLLEADKISDDMYYIKDILCVGKSHISEVVTCNLLNFLIFPILCPLLRTKQNDGSNISTVTSLYIVSRLTQVVASKEISDIVAGILLRLFASIATGDVCGLGVNRNGSYCFNVLGTYPASQAGVVENIDWNPLHWYFSGSGVLSYVVSEDHCLTLASLFLLLTCANIDGKQNMKVSFYSRIEVEISYTITIALLYFSVLQTFNALLNILRSESSVPGPLQYYTGWFLHKLLMFQGKGLDDQNLELFKNSYKRIYELLEKELDGCWYDHVLPTIRGLWNSCTAALEESSLSKDPVFLLELSVCQITNEGDSTSYAAWHRMVDVVKVFILHIQLNALISNRKFLENPLLDSTNSLQVTNDPFPSFASDVSLGPEIACRIAFPNAGIHHVYLIPEAKGMSGKLLLAEKHPFRSRRGVVIASAPLAGLSPKMDEANPTWMNFTIREFEPSISRGYDQSNCFAADGRWRLGFRDAKACKDARSAIVQEASKQKSAIRSALAPLLHSKYPGDVQESRHVK